VLLTQAGIIKSGAVLAIEFKDILGIMTETEGGNRKENF
jgi:hypothetical protein